MRTWAGFQEGEIVEYIKNGTRHVASVAEGYDRRVETGCVPIVLIPEGCLLIVPADSLDRT